MDHRTPQQTTFTVPELLEPILLFTSPTPTRLLSLRLINRTANATILCAQAFRRALFLDDATPSHPNPTATTVEINPLLEKAFPAFMQTQFKRIRRRAEADAAAALGYVNFGTGEDEASDSVPQDSYLSASPTILPSMEKAERCRGRDFKWACLGSSYMGPCLHLPVVGRRGGEEHLRAVGEGIWRAMYATRPTVVVHVVGVGACGGVDHVWEVRAGARMGEVMDALVFGLDGKRGVECGVGERVLKERGCTRVLGCDNQKAGVVV